MRFALRGPSYALLAGTELFDRAWYLDRNADVQSSRDDPVAHYLRQGAAAGRDPHPLFDTDWYGARHSDVTAGGNPLVHYIKDGRRAGLNPNPLFDSAWYRRRYSDALSGATPFAHFLHKGAAELRDPGPCFDSAWYLRTYPDVAGSGLSPLAHFLADGAVEGRRPNDPAVLLAGLKVAVVVHLYHTELWGEIAGYLQNIPVAFGLWITAPHQRIDAARRRVQRAYPHATFVPLDNVGRDTVPFLAVMPHLVEGGYDVVCKLHTKEGATEPETWRRLLLEGTLADRLLVTRILCAFKEDRELQLVGHADLYMSGPQYMTENRALLEETLERAAPGSPMPSEWGFFAGTMFWIRPALLSGLAEVVRVHEALETDDKATDGQLAHVIERMCGLLACVHAGKIGLTGRIGDGPLDATLDIVRAPHRPHRRALADYLRAQSARRQAYSVPKPPPLRDWRVPAGRQPGVNFIGPVEYISGLGTSARGYVRALQESGIATNVVPWRLGFDRLKPQNWSFPPSSRQPINLVHVNLDLLTNAGLLDRKPLQELVTPETFNIAIVYWELAALPPDWSEVIARFDEIWCASSFVARAVGAVSSRPVRVVRPCLPCRTVATPPMRRAFGLPEDRFVFFYAADSGSILGRKNPRALLEAYLAEFAEADGAFCLLKLHHADPESPPVRELLDLAARRSDLAILDRSLSEEEMLGLFGVIDCYVSPHRSEGLGLTILEAMQAGKPVIATPFGGASDFVTETTARVLDYRMIEVGPGCEPYPAEFVWADPLPASLRRALRSVLEEREATCAMAARGRAVATDTYAPQTTAGIIRSEIHRVWRAGGGSLS